MKNQSNKDDVWTRARNICSFGALMTKDSSQSLMITDCITQPPKPNQSYYFIQIFNDQLTYETATSKAKGPFKIECDVEKKSIMVNGQTSHDGMVKELLGYIQRASEQLTKKKATILIKNHTEQGR